MPNESRPGVTGERTPEPLSAVPTNSLTGPYLPSGRTPEPSATDGPVAAGRNLLDNEIGRGGMGAVFKGRNIDLGRELAIKVLLDEHRDRPELVRRFLEEAQIAGQLQHPGVAPVYELGRFADDRPYFTMKLVQGHTLAELLRQRTEPRQHLGRFVSIFAQVCQTMAYAHSQGVIHRDLKPSNVMVGGFGEVQVMDWGLAKVLRPNAASGPERLESKSAPVIKTSHSGSTAEQAQTGIVGTPAYMPPEQARGEPTDERADVFSLGALLCEILNGRPVYSGPGANLWDRARAGVLREVFDRLDGCNADVELIALAKRCLAERPDDRPRHAGAVAQLVTDYLAAVEGRTRQAEQDRAAALARAEEAKATAAAERRAKRLLVGLASAALLLVVAGGAVAWIVQQQHAAAVARQQEADHNARDRMDQARTLLKDGWDRNDADLLANASLTADRAAEIAVGSSDSVREEAAALRREVEDALQRSSKNRALTTALLDIAEPRELRKDLRAGAGAVLDAAQPSVDDQLTAAFRTWGVNLDGDVPETALVKFRSLPTSVVQEVVAGLDAWAAERRRQNRPEAAWRRLHELADQLDGNERRREIRGLQASGAAATHGKRLEELAGQIDPQREPVLSVLLLARTLGTAGQSRRAEELLRAALAARPNEVVLLEGLGRLLEQQRPPRLGEAIECFRTARGLRPSLGIALAEALAAAGRSAEGTQVVRDLVRRQPERPELHFHLGNALWDQKEPVEAEAAYRKALALKPDYYPAIGGLGIALFEQKKLEDAVAAFRRVLAVAPDDPKAHANLGLVLQQQNKLGESIAAYHKAIALKPDYSLAYHNLGAALWQQKKPDEALAAYRKAVEINPDYAYGHNGLGAALAQQKKFAEAADAYRKAIASNPNFPEAYYNLGNVLRDQRKLDEAVAAFRQAIALRANYPMAYNNLGVSLEAQDQLAEAVAAFHKAIEYRPQFPEAYYNLGNALRKLRKLDEALVAFRKADQLLPGHPSIQNNLRRMERWVELDRRLPAVLAGKDSLGTAQEQLEMALLCASVKQTYRAAAGFYVAAFAAEPTLVTNLRWQHRYNAACAAALAAADKGEDAAKLDDKERGRLRQQSLDWLSAELALWKLQTDTKDAGVREQVQKTLEHWQRDPDLAGLRERTALTGLPTTEGDNWRKLWEEVEAVRKKAAAAP